MEIARIDAEPGSAEDAARTRALCQKNAAGWLVLDGFHFSPSYCASVRHRMSRLLLVDDHGKRAPYRCDIILNVNPQASNTMYVDREKLTRLLIGPRYALLRQEFLNFRQRRADVPCQARRILITFGGADPRNVTLKVLQALLGIKKSPLDITVIVGASNPHHASLRAVAGRTSGVKLALNVRNMPEYMAHSDLALTAGGGTCFELAFMKVPMFLITMAKNHEETVEAFAEAEAALTAGWFGRVTKNSLVASLGTVIADRDLRRRLRTNAGRMVDGRGAERVVETMHLLGRRGRDEY
jgi:UDP-2,4-diacetamido-2,4,6-trideoxy-beta-L-altropyranose hydrolase